MISSRIHFRKVCALVTAALVLPALAYADKGDKGDKGDKSEHKGKRSDIPAVPEANVGWVLLPFLGIVLVFSARQLFRAKATDKDTANL
jgi:hypothetical protein